MGLAVVIITEIKKVVFGFFVGHYVHEDLARNGAEQRAGAREGDGLGPVFY
jgi:hypothetical protein